MLFVRSDDVRAAPWYLAQVRPNCLSLAERALGRQGFDLFSPKIMTTVRRRGRLRETPRALFTGYVFVSFDPDRPDWRAINATPGVSRLVRFGDAPPPLPASLVADLMLRCDDRGHLLPPEDLAPGDRVRIARGPFASFVTTVERVDAERRVHVLLEMLGRRTRLSLDPGDLQRE